MLKRIADLLLAVWARFNKPPDLPKFQPMESLSDHLKQTHQYAAENYGALRRLGSEAEMRQLLAVTDRWFDVEVIALVHVRDFQPTVATNVLGDKLVWSRYADSCTGWQSETQLARNGVDALKLILDTVDSIKKERPLGKDIGWNTVSWLVEVRGECQWLHYMVRIIHRTGNGSYHLATCHFFLSDITDLLFPT